MPLLAAVHYTQTNVALLQKYSMLRVCFCSEHTRHRLCSPFEGQWFECFTSNRLSWDANGLAYPWKCHLLSHFLHANGYTVDNQIRTCRKFLWVILPPHNLWIRNVFSMVMSVRWKNSFFVHFHVLQAIP
jgi:hypothetical protein